MMKQRMTIAKESAISGKVSEITILADPKDIERWNRGELIQNALPYLTIDEREFLMTGITPEEWEETFKDE